MRRGLGIGIAHVGRRGPRQQSPHHDSTRTARSKSNSAAQDLGAGTRTIIAMVAAETLGLPLSTVKVKIGDNTYPVSGPSGGSTTVGGVSLVNAQGGGERAAEAVRDGGPTLERAAGPAGSGGRQDSDEGQSRQGHVLAAGLPEARRQHDHARWARTIRSEPKGLNTGGASGIQMADVSVDIETGIVKMNKLVAVQDCGLVINPKTGRKPGLGACIMSICAALMEERVMDQQTGRVLNADMEFYKLAGIADIGDIVVHMDITRRTTSAA